MMDAPVNGDGPEQLGEPVDRVTLGKHDYHVYEQRVGYLENKLKRTFAKLVEGKIEGADDLLGALITDNVYKLLKVFFGSRLMPEWEFHGYATEEAWRAGDYDEKYDQSPGPTQVKHALGVCMRVNSLDLFKDIAGFFPKDTRDAIVNELVLAAIKMLQSGGLPQNASATTTPGAPSTTSGTTDSTTADVELTDGSTSD
jgi:hypothetical protein